MEGEIMIEPTHRIGNSSSYAIEYAFLDESHETEFAMYIAGTNILSFRRAGKALTTRWNLDELVFWLRDFLDHMADDPYPVDVEGEYAACKDIAARDFDTEDEAGFDAYYDKLDEWNLRHRWHPASSGAILADLYFQLVGEKVEISWNNQDSEEGVIFENILGGASVPREEFYFVVDSFLKKYTEHWYR